MFFKKINNKIKVGRKYTLNGVECEALTISNDGDVALVRENDGNLAFVIGGSKGKNNNIVAAEVIGFTVSDTEMVEYLNTHCINLTGSLDSSVIAQIIRNKYYKIPTYLAEVIAIWYMASYGR